MNLLNQLPCPVLVTDRMGRVLMANTELSSLVGVTTEQAQHSTIEDLLPPASRIFLQTHVWPLLLREGEAKEIYLQVRDALGQRIPVMVNSSRGEFDGVEAYHWVFFVAKERSQFEAALLDARKRAEIAAETAAAAERFISTITDAMPSLVGYWDKDLRCRFANKPYQEWFGKPLAEILGMSMLELMGERLFALNKPLTELALAGEAQQFERSLAKADGSIGHTLAHYIPDLDAKGHARGFFVLVTDVTRLKVAEAELGLAASVFHNTIEGIMVTDNDGNILSVNPSFTAITGYSAEEAIGKTPNILRSHHHGQDFFNEMARELAAKGRWEGETWSRRKDGDAFRQWQTITTIPATVGAGDRYVLVFNDITERWRNDERTRHLAFHDVLTGLPNRALLMERLGQLINLARRETRKLALLFLDLDGFKAVNDSLGHDAGDDLLVAVANALRPLVRQTDTVARLGGDEFVVLLDNPESVDQIGRVAARIVETLSQPLNLDGKPAQIGVSIGISLHPAAGQTANGLLRSADAALYAAKRAGKGRWCFFEPEMLAQQQDMTPIN